MLFGTQREKIKYGGRMTACADGAARCREGEALSSICTVLYLPLEDIKPEGMTGQRRISMIVHACGVCSSGISRCVYAFPSGCLLPHSGRCKVQGGGAAAAH